MIEGACNNHVLTYDDVIYSIKVNDDVIHGNKVDDAFNGCHNIFIKQGTYSNNNNIDNNNHYNKRFACNNTRNSNQKYDNYIGNNTTNNATPCVPILYMIVSLLFVIPFIYCNMQYCVKKRAKGGVKGITIMIINVYIIMLLLQGTVYCCGKLYASTRILNQTYNNSNNNQCNNNNNKIDLLMLYTNINTIFSLYCVTQSMSLSNVRLPNVHTMTTVEMLTLSLLELFGECSKRMQVMKLLIMTELGLSVNIQKL